MPTLGSQALLRVLPYTRYDFGPLKSATVTIPLAQHIDVLGYADIPLQVRIRAGTFPAGAALRVHLADDGYSPEDPATDFLRTAVDGKDIGTLEVTERTMFPFYQSVAAPVRGNFGRMMGIMASFTGGPEGGPSAVMSLDVVLSGGSVGTTIQQPATYLGYAHEPFESEAAFEPLQFEPAPGTMQPEPLSRLLVSLRGLIGARLPGYPRFGNVNVARIDPDYPRFGNVNVARTDPEYPRFGNVNVARTEPPPPGSAEPDD